MCGIKRGVRGGGRGHTVIKNKRKIRTEEKGISWQHRWIAFTLYATNKSRAEPARVCTRYYRPLFIYAFMSLQDHVMYSSLSMI